MSSSLLDSEAVYSAAPLTFLANSFLVSGVLKAALDLHLFDLLSTQALTLKELSEKLDMPRRAARSFLNACASAGLIIKKEDRYQNTMLAETYLVKGKPYYFGGYLAFEINRLFPPTHHLAETLKTGGLKKQNAAESIFDVYAEDPELGLEFFQQFHVLSGLTAPFLLEKIDLSDRKTVLDLGGGSGSLSIELAKSFPYLKFTLFDLPGICKIADHFIQEASLDSRISLYPGDFFKDDLPSGFDLILLSAVVNLWNPEQNEILVKKCWDALVPGGKIIMVGSMLNDNEYEPLELSFVSLISAIDTQGAIYTWKEQEEFLTKAGFQNLVRFPITAPIRNGVIVGVKLKD